LWKCNLPRSSPSGYGQVFHSNQVFRHNTAQIYYIATYLTFHSSYLHSHFIHLISPRFPLYLRNCDITYFATKLFDRHLKYKYFSILQILHQAPFTLYLTFITHYSHIAHRHYFFRTTYCQREELNWLGHLLGHPFSALGGAAYISLLVSRAVSGSIKQLVLVAVSDAAPKQ